MEYIVLIGLFVVGTIFGSFGSVVLTRFSDEISWQSFKGFLFGKSKCPDCHHVLKAKNLIPFFSYIFQKGKCDYCHKKISMMYPLLELFSGLVFLFTYIIGAKLRHLGYGEIAFWLFLNRSLLLLIFWDFLRYELHFVVWIAVLLIALFFQFFGLVGSYKWAFFGSLIFGGFFYLIYLLANWYIKIKYNQEKGGFGMGDVFMAFLLGVLVPFVFQYNNMFPNISDIFILIFIFLLMSSLIGLIYGLRSFGLHKTGKSDFMKFRIPFVPSMILGFWLLLLFRNFFYKILFF